MNKIPNREEVRRNLEIELGCTIQHDGWPCGSCFCTLDADVNLKEDIGEYWQAVLDFRGDYDDFEWDIDTDTSKFHDLIIELHEKLKGVIDE